MIVSATRDSKLCIPHLFLQLQCRSSGNKREKKVSCWKEWTSAAAMGPICVGSVGVRGAAQGWSGSNTSELQQAPADGRYGTHKHTFTERDAHGLQRDGGRWWMKRRGEVNVVSRRQIQQRMCQKTTTKKNNKEKLNNAVVLKPVQVIIFSWSWQIFQVNVKNNTVNKMSSHPHDRGLD